MKKANVKWIAIIASVAILLAGCVVMAVALQANATRDITEQRAKEIALAHAGIQESDVTALQIRRGTENGIEVYSVEFDAAGREYDYDIRVRNGDIVQSSYDMRVQQAPQPVQETEPVDGSAPQTADSTGNAQGGSGNITQEQAKSIALSHAGVSESDITFIWVKPDVENGTPVYEVEFLVGNTEYDYNILQSTGEIVKMDHDIERAVPGGDSAGVSVSMEDARAMALAKVAGASDQDIKIQLDWDDGRPVYEGEIYLNGTEYEFEIDASSGSFLEWSVDYR